MSETLLEKALEYCTHSKRNESKYDNYSRINGYNNISLYARQILFKPVIK